MSKFFVEENAVNNNKIFIEDKDDINHITKVLRLGPGDIIDISDSNQWDYRCEILDTSDGMIEVKILGKEEFSKEPKLRVTLFQGIPKKGKMELIVQKGTELGMASFVPVFMDRTIIADKGNLWKKLVRLRSITLEASKQCKRGIVPEIRHEIYFEEMLKRLDEYDLIIFPYEMEENFTIKELLQGLEKKVKNIAIIIGPEGGFSDEEAQLLLDKGVKAVSLGKTILRTETAGIATLAMVMYQLEL